MLEYDAEIDYRLDDLLREEVRIGKQCEIFWSSDVGKYILGRAREEMRELMKELYEAEPDNRKAQTNIRQDINLRVLMVEYLSEKIQRGTNARNQLEEESG